MKNPGIAIAAFLFASVPAFAQAPTGGAIMKACGTSAARQDSVCNSFINGMVTGLAADEIAGKAKTPICLPPHVTTAQVRQKIAQFLYARPDTWRVEGAAAIALALVDAYPCKPRK